MNCQEPGIVGGVLEQLLERSQAKLVEEIRSLLKQGLQSLETRIVREEIKNSTPKGYLSVTKCAERSGKSERTIRNWIERGYLKGTRPFEGAAWVVSEEDLNRCLSGGASMKLVQSAPISEDHRALLIAQRHGKGRDK